MKRRMMKPMAYVEPFSQIKIKTTNKQIMNETNNIQHFIFTYTCNWLLNNNNIPIISNVNITKQLLCYSIICLHRKLLIITINIHGFNIFLE